MEQQCEVLDFSIVARWEEGLPAEVFLFTKVAFPPPPPQKTYTYG